MPNDIRSKYKNKNCNEIKRTDTHFPHLLAKNEKGEPKQGQRALYYYCTGCYAAAKAELEALRALGRERHRGYSLMIALQVSQAKFTLFLPVPSDQPNLEQAKLENSAGATPSAQMSQQAVLDAVVTAGVQSLRGKGAELRECGVTKLTDVKTGYLLVTWTKGAGSLPQLMKLKSSEKGITDDHTLLKKLITDLAGKDTGRVNYDTTLGRLADENRRHHAVTALILASSLPEPAASPSSSSSSSSASHPSSVGSAQPWSSSQPSSSPPSQQLPPSLPQPENPQLLLLLHQHGVAPTTTTAALKPAVLGDPGLTRYVSVAGTGVTRGGGSSDDDDERPLILKSKATAQGPGSKSKRSKRGISKVD